VEWFRRACAQSDALLASVSLAAAGYGLRGPSSLLWDMHVPSSRGGVAIRKRQVKLIVAWLAAATAVANLLLVLIQLVEVVMSHH
jgi:hypothetical protein